MDICWHRIMNRCLCFVCSFWELLFLGSTDQGLPVGPYGTTDPSRWGPMAPMWLGGEVGEVLPHQTQLISNTSGTAWVERADQPISMGFCNWIPIAKSVKCSMDDGYPVLNGKDSRGRFPTLWSTRIWVDVEITFRTRSLMSLINPACWISVFWTHNFELYFIYRCIPLNSIFTVWTDFSFRWWYSPQLSSVSFSRSPSAFHQGDL